MDNQAFQQKKAEILSRINLRALAEEAGAEFMGDSSACPLHLDSDNRSAFHIYENGTRWHCFTGCPDEHRDGDAFKFYMRWKGVPFWNAFLDLAQRAGVYVDAQQGHPVVSETAPGNGRGYFRNKPAPKAPGDPWQERAEAFVKWAEEQLEVCTQAREYLQRERGLHDPTWWAFRLGFNFRDFYDDPIRWGLSGKKIWLPRGIVIPGLQREKFWYVKVRRAVEAPAGLPEADDGPRRMADYLGQEHELLDAKFGGPRGGQAAIFGADLWLGLPVLLLVEGEWDAMLAYQEGGDLCDVATLGSSTNRADALDLAALAKYAAIVQISDEDEAGEKARNYWKGFGRVTIVHPPAHDLTDYWRDGGSLRMWIARLVEQQMESLLAGLDAQRFADTYEEWKAAWEAAKRITTDSRIVQNQ